MLSTSAFFLCRMSLLHLNTPRCSVSFVSAALDCGSKLITDGTTNNLSFEVTKEKIKQLFNQIELSVSSYDTAWVAMVPSPSSPKAPCFPECLYWLLDNQLYDGSWPLPRCHPLLMKDALSSTLACVLSLRKWGIGEEQMNKGLQFIESNFSSLTDEKQYTPIGFDIIFPGMIEYAKDLNLSLPLQSKVIDTMLHRRDLELRRRKVEGREAHLAYVSEGIQKLQDWELVMKYQRKNGSLFNSPATTAAALCHFQNVGCLDYLHALLERFGNAVPTVYPFDIHARLCMIECIDNLGIGRHFKKEMKDWLDETYQSWQRGEEEVFLEPATCAMAFRILRVNGYNVSSDLLSQYAEEDFHNWFRGYVTDMNGALELYRASQLVIYPDESVLEKQNSWTRQLLKEELSNDSVDVDGLRKHIKQKVNDAFQFPYHANLKFLAHRRNIENHTVDNIGVLKTSYRFSNIRNEDFLRLAVEDFNICQSAFQEELKHLERWVEEKRLNKLKFARQKLAYCYFSAAATLFSPELSDARISWAKNGVLTTVVDDFFDIGGSEEELVNLIQLLENTKCRFDSNIGMPCCSEPVQIIFSALHSTISEIGESTVRWQRHSARSHIIQIWLDLLMAMLREAEWSRNKSVPTVEEYMENGYVSFALGPVILPALYLVGPRLSEEVVKSHEYNDLYKLVSTCGRLLNDIHSFKRESREGKLNALSLNMIHGPPAVTEEDVVKEVKNVIANSRRELLRLVLQENGSIVPRTCKDLFWNMSQILHVFYMKDDGFTSHEMFNVVNAVIHKPLALNEV